MPNTSVTPFPARPRKLLRRNKAQSATLAKGIQILCKIWVADKGCHRPKTWLLVCNTIQTAAFICWSSVKQGSKAWHDFVLPPLFRSFLAHPRSQNSVLHHMPSFEVLGYDVERRCNEIWSEDYISRCPRFQDAEDQVEKHMEICAFGSGNLPEFQQPRDVESCVVAKMVLLQRAQQMALPPNFLDEISEPSSAIVCRRHGHFCFAGWGIDWLARM